MAFLLLHNYTDFIYDPGCQSGKIPAAGNRKLEQTDPWLYRCNHRRNCGNHVSVVTKAEKGGQNFLTA